MITLCWVWIIVHIAEGSQTVFCYSGSMTQGLDSTGLIFIWDSVCVFIIRYFKYRFVVKT